MTKAKKQGSENSVQGSVEASGSEVKPKAVARKKKVDEPTEAVAMVAAAKPAKKATKKAVKAVEKPEAAVEVAETPVEPEKPTAKKAAAKKAAPKKAVAKKGRDLVVDEPGAAEVAAVLHETPLSVDTSEDDDEPALPVRSASKKQAKVAEEPEVARPEPKLERLQKILAKAGISSRRKAEELILGGQVQINGKIVTELGTKADPERDHVRVDGKLLQGPERIRYFVLNKPKGYVTTVSDPENRPTVMQFFSSERERLYPVGRLDYLSEGLLLVTNDGELANKLTKASSGVEKTYLVKVAGQPTEDMLDVLRGGVVIEKGRPGTYSGRVRTAPAQIRQVRQGDNPWYEVIIIEGRNRELRKMFEEIGHHVEKIRRVGYGPLVLDLEPGKSRELDAEEVQSLRLASEGKLKTRRRRSAQQAQLPTVAGKTVRYKKADGKPGYEPRRPAVRPEFEIESKAEFKPDFRKEIKAGFKREPKDGFPSAPKAGFKPASERGAKPSFSKPGFSKPGFAKPSFGAGRKPGFGADRESGREEGAKPEFRGAARPPFKKAGNFGGKPEFRSGPPAASRSSAGTSGFGGRRDFAGKPRNAEPPVTDYVLPPRKPLPPESDLPPSNEFNPDYKPGFRTGGKTDRPGARPAFRQDGPPKRFGGDRSGSGDRGFKSAGPRRDFAPPAAIDDDWVPTKTPGFKIEPVEDKPRAARSDRPSPGGRPPFRPRTDGPPSGGSRAGGGKPFRPAGGDRPYRPRTDGPPSGPGARAGARPFRPESRSDSRPARPAGEGGEFKPRGDFKPRGEFKPRTDGPRSAGARSERPAFGSPKKFGGPKPFGSPKPFGGAGRSRSAEPAGSEGAPKKKERWRDSFTGKNKGRPKPKPKSE